MSQTRGTLYLVATPIGNLEDVTRRALRVLRACVERNLSVVPVPGPTAFVAALTASGLPTDEFYFGGFLPARGHARREKLASVKSLRATLVFYETPHRLAHALADAREVLGEREAAVARELTKVHEEIVRGRLSELAARFTPEGAARGEMVLVIDRDVIDEGVAEGTSTTSSVAGLVARFEAEG